MKRIVTIIAVSFLCFGCSKQRQVKHTTFFNSHNAKHYLDAVAKAQGDEVRDGGASHSSTASIGSKEYITSIKGGHVIKDALMTNYMDHVKSELRTAGLSITDSRSGIGVQYRGNGVAGIVRASFEVDQNGYINAVVSVYEHVL